MKELFELNKKFIISLFFAICLIILPAIKTIDWFYQLNSPVFLHYSQDALLGFYGQFLCFVGALLLGIFIYTNDKRKELIKICSDNTTLAIELTCIYNTLVNNIYSKENLKKLQDINKRIIVQFNLIYGIKSNNEFYAKTIAELSLITNMISDILNFKDENIKKEFTEALQEKITFNYKLNYYDIIDTLTFYSDAKNFYEPSPYTNYNSTKKEKEEFTKIIDNEIYVYLLRNNEKYVSAIYLKKYLVNKIIVSEYIQSYGNLDEMYAERLINDVFAYLGNKNKYGKCYYKNNIAYLKI